MGKRKWYNGATMVASVTGLAGFVVGAMSGSAWAGLGVAALLLGYWLPALVAYGRRVQNTGQVAVVNLFAFLLGVPWIIALVMAAKPVHHTAQHAARL